MIVRVGSIRIDEGYDIKLSGPPVYYPTFKGTGGGNDIAIFYLAEDIPISKDAFPACLDHGKVPLEIESRATIIGFGKTQG